MNGKAKYVNDQKNFEAHVFCKSRVVDPLVLVSGKAKRLSSVFPEWKGIVSFEKKPKEYFIRFED